MKKEVIIVIVLIALVMILIVLGLYYSYKPVQIKQNSNNITFQNNDYRTNLVEKEKYNNEVIEMNDNKTNGEIINNNECIKIGCDSTTQYAGTLDSDKYYNCDCSKIKNQNIACFNSAGDAKNKGYTIGEC